MKKLQSIELIIGTAKTKLILTPDNKDTTTILTILINHPKNRYPRTDHVYRNKKKSINYHDNERFKFGHN